jgi:hypothetical protein
MEDKTTRCTAQHLAWFITHLAMILVHFKKILFINDQPDLIALVLVAIHVI